MKRHYHHEKQQIGKTTPLKIPKNCGHRSKMWAEEDIDERAIHRGAKIEFEHTCDKEAAERISLDHIAEFGIGYYPALEKMENQLAKELKKNKPKGMTMKDYINRQQAKLSKKGG